MQWPVMLTRTHERHVADLEAHQQQHIELLTDTFQKLVDAEYTRARDEGRRQVHAWAVEVNYNLFCGGSPFGNMQGTQRMRATAALQDAERQFAPSRTQLEATKEITDATVRP